MTVIDDKSIFIAMKQDGPFAVHDELVFDSSFTRHARAWSRTFYNNPSTVSKYRAVRSQVFDLLQVDEFRQIPDLIDDDDQRALRTERAYRLFANLYGINGGLSEIEGKVREYAHSADYVIDYLKLNVFSDYQSNIEISNEIEAIHNPIDLLFIIFDPRYHKKSRFEAKRKLVLMALAGSIDQRERETDIEKKFSTFLDFLNRKVWSPDLKIGELSSAWLLSKHDPDDYSCVDVSVIEDMRVAADISPRKLEKLTLIKRRHFKTAARDIPVYVTVRKKDAAAKILKLLRKNEKNPAVAVDDELGLMAVLDNVADVKQFVKHLGQAAVDADSIMVLEDISDTLTGGFYNASSEGSSHNTAMLKFFARLGGMRVEFIIHTNETYLNYRYQQDVAHGEYEVRRIFDSGVAEFLFPQDIYHLDMKKVRDNQIKKFRENLYDSSHNPVPVTTGV